MDYTLPGHVILMLSLHCRFFDGGKEFSVFGEDGNGVTGFDVLNVQKNTDGSPHYVKVIKFEFPDLIG